ncbi:MAG TPA: ParB-like protein [Rhodocyclaceae bacterium]|nr:ParB-like protein [Rhodocyclaceae bacterium]
MARIQEVEIHLLRPTQLTVGFIEVKHKQARLEKLKADEQRDFMQAHPIPAVLGPSEHLFITDHHHLGRAAFEAGVTSGFVEIDADLSTLEKDAFWVEMDKRRWVHPLDQNGVRHYYSSIPHHLEALVDDVYRSLAGYVRDAGGYQKTPTAFAEFVWADFFRRNVAIEDVQKDFDAAVKHAMLIAQSDIAQRLPGYCGIPAPSK